ncbi:MAG: autotransporter domain-containing protein [Pseudomonadota bacterium]|nr:autotransporter domain-containing protein [Pseudomonadota bacterium]
MNYKTHGVPLLLLSAAVSTEVYAIATAVDDQAQVFTDSIVDIDVAANDDFNAEGLPTIILSENGPFYGSAIVNQNGTITYTPDPGYEGTDQFDYFIWDDDGQAYGDTGTVTVTVNPLPATGDEGPLETLADTESERVTARMLETLCEEGSNQESLTQELADECSRLLGQSEVSYTADEIRQLLGDITPEEILMQRRMLAEIMRGQADRLYGIRRQLRQEEGVATAGPDTLLLNSYVGGVAGESAPPLAWFGSVKFGNTEHDQTDRESGYDADITSLMLGLNYRLRPDLDLGLALDMTQYDVDYESGAGELESSTNTLSGYGSWYRDAFGVDVILGYTTGDIETERTVSLPTPDVIAGETDADMLFLSTQFQYSYVQGALTSRPFLRIDYLSAEVDAYSETGSNPWLMNVGKQELDQVNFHLGVDTSYALSYDWGVMVPGVVVSVISEGSQDYSPVAFSLVQDSTNFSEFELRPDGEDSLFYQLDLNSVFVMKNGFSTYISAQFTLGYDDIDAYTLQGGFNYEL